MTNQLKRFKFKLYLEGVSIPFRSANISYTSDSSFQINLPPYHEALQLKENTYALLLFKRRTTEESWKFLGEGVLVGKSYSKRPDDRSVMLRFKSVKWFYQIAQIYNLFGDRDHTFALTESSFFGDSRLSDEAPEEIQRTSNTEFFIRNSFVNAFEEGSEKPITDSINTVFNNYLYGNEFVKEYGKKFKLAGDRVKVIENKKTKQVFTYNGLLNAYEEIFNQITTTTNVMDLVLSLGQIIRYDFVPVPGFVGGPENTIYSFLYKPNLELATPPACNVIFPDENTSFSFQKNEEDLPTRFRLMDQAVGIESQGYFAPKELEESFKGEDTDVNDRFKVTDLEKFKGVIPHQTSIPLVQTMAMRFDENSLKDMGIAKSLFTNYMFYHNQYKTVPMNIEISFKPDILPGFPILVMDKEIPMLGYVSGLSHNISPSSGYASTSINISHARTFDTKSPVLAGWYDQGQFSPEQIGEHMYQQLGTTSFFEGFSTPEEDDDNFIDYSKPIREIQQAREDTGDRIKFQNQFNRELSVFNSEDEEDVMDKLGLEWDGEELRGGPLNIELEVDDSTVSEIRRERVYQLKERMKTITKRKFAREDDE